MSPGEELGFEQTIAISATPAEVWNALVTPAIVKRYHLAPLHGLDLKPGGKIVYGTADEILISGTIAACEPERTLSHSFRFGPPGHPGTDGDNDTRVTYRLESKDGGTLLSLVHDGFKEENQTFANISGGWPNILEGLQRLLEDPRGANR